VFYFPSSAGAIANFLLFSFGNDNYGEQLLPKLEDEDEDSLAPAAACKSSFSLSLSLSSSLA
jgi:hypothetical protein